MSTTPTAEPIDIAVRHPQLALPDSIPRYWYGGDPFATHFLDALSSLFPDGEAFFVRSVRAFRERIDEPQLLQAVRAFAGQEGQHSHHHDRHVRMLIERGYPGLARRNRVLGRVLRWHDRHVPRPSLAGTAAVEHLTAMLARRLLSEPDRWLAPMDPHMAKLWHWHALEEAEHKSVAFDVLQRVAPSHPLRAWALATNTAMLLLETLERTAYMLRRDGLLWRRDVWARGWRFLFGRDDVPGSGDRAATLPAGLLRGLGAEYRAWYRRDFHPDQIDDRERIVQARAAVGA